LEHENQHPAIILSTWKNRNNKARGMTTSRVLN
jgi:hypothetical protein